MTKKQNKQQVARTSSALTTFLQKRWFILGMIAAIALAAFFPKAGTSLNPNKITTTAMVVMMFFLSGLSLPTETLKDGMRDIRLHVYIQVFIFIICPLYFVLTAFPFENIMNGKLIIGIYALAVLPTTVSSCTVFTQLAKGNTIGTIFNASFSNLAGIFLSPLLLTLFMKGSGTPMPMEELVRIFTSLVLKMLIPFAVGQGLHIAFRRFARKYEGLFGIISSVCVLVIIFFGVSRSAGDASFQTYGKQLILPFLYLAVSNVILLLLSLLGANLLRMKRMNVISVVYTAPQKTLAIGIPLLSTYFVSQPEVLGIAILPILFYHPWQLFIAGLIKNSTYIQRWIPEK